MRKLASVQKILAVEPIEKADKLEVVTVLGWHCVAKKGDFKVGDSCVYFEVDSLLPMVEQFDFLKSRGTTKLEDETEGYRIKTIRLRGQISQGLVFKVSEFPQLSNVEEGDDVTDVLGVKQWYPIVPACMKGLVKGSFPSFIPKTDETRVQNLQRVLTRFKGLSCYVTEKLDGTSVTYYLKDGEFGVCSRNQELKETKDNLYWKVAREYDIENKLRNCGVNNIAIQGEIFGPGVQGNSLMMPKVCIRFFNVFDIDKFAYLDFINAEIFIDKMILDFVPVLSVDYILGDDIDEIVKGAEGKSVLNVEKDREGVVIRPLKEMMDLELAKGLGNGRLSFKAINPEYLLLNE
jgi:RNA ligase (TIGR02306 family)